MEASLRGRLFPNSGVCVLVTVILVVQTQNMDYSQWKPIQLYVAGNITFTTRIGHPEGVHQNATNADLGFNGQGTNASSLWRRSNWGFREQASVYKNEDQSIFGTESFLQDSINIKSSARSATGELMREMQATENNAGDSIKAESKEEEVEPRKKKKKLLKKLALPLMVMYKIKLLMLVPVMVASLVLLSGTSGLVGYFFALFVTLLAHGKEH